MKYYTFSCGCKFPIISEDPLQFEFNFTTENVPLNCTRTWNLISEGNTKGIFQLESKLGQKLSEQLKPNNIEHLSALISIMRPGCMEAIRDDKSVTNHYIDRKNGNEAVDYYHQALESVLSTTYGEMCIHENTFISMSDGSEKRIKDICVGELTQSLNEHTLLIQQKDMCVRVLPTRKEKGLTIRLENGYEVTVTKNHPMLTNNGWVDAKNLNANFHVVASCIKQYNNKQTKKQFGDIKWMRISSITETKNIEQFYSISIYNNHNVIANGIIIKNCYQEQAMQIAMKIAGFDMQQSDLLRKSIGKKLPELMAKVKKEFLDGCKKTNVVTEKEAEEIFGWIEKGQRYAFNKSHSVSYAMNAYLSAYAKAHFPKAFFTSYLHHSLNKQDTQTEIAQLINNCRSMGIDVNPPNIQHLNVNFKLINQKIYFGLLNIKGIGERAIVSLQESINKAEQTHGPISTWTWTMFLFLVANDISKTTTLSLIRSGALDTFKLPRATMVYEYNIYYQLNKKESGWICKNVDFKNMTLKQCLWDLLESPVGRLGGCSTKPRHAVVQKLHKLLVQPTSSLEDSVESVVSDEEFLLGIALTYSLVEKCDISIANCTCRDIIHDTHTNKTYLLAGVIDSVKETTDKNGNNMAFLSVSDISGQLDVAIFSNEWNLYKSVCYETNTVMVVGKKGKTKNGLIVSKIYQLTR